MTNPVVLETRQFLERINGQEEKKRRSMLPVSKINRFVICFGGKFKTGKSSLINALSGMELLPTKATTATTVLTRIIRGDVLRAWHCMDGKYIPLSIESAHEIILTQRSFSEIIFEVPIPWLPSYVELRDTPGTEDEMILEEIADAAMQDADLCVCVFDASNILSDKERLRTAQLFHQLGGNLVYAINRTNTLHSLEDIQDVEETLASYVSTMDHPNAEMGKRFTMCSKPGMIYLDGFDKWLKALIRSDKMPLLNDLRATAHRSQLQTMLNDHHEKATLQLEKVNASLKETRNRGNVILEKKRQEIKKNAEQAQKSIECKESILKSKLSELSGLEDKITACMNGDGWLNNYSSRTKSTTKQFFYEKFKILQKSSEYTDALADLSFVEKSFIDSFPSPTFTHVSATGGDVAGGAGLFGAIGFLVGGPAGAAIGAAVGAAIGGSGEERNDSVLTTMRYIRSTIIPKMGINLSTSIKQAAKTKKDNIMKTSNIARSGLEPAIDELLSVRLELLEYLKMAEMR